MQYNNIITTTAGLALLARAVAGEITLQFDYMKASDYEYPAGTDYSALTDLQSIKQTINCSDTTIQNNTTVRASGLFNNSGIVVAYTMRQIGLYSGTTLVGVITSTDPFIMPISSSGNTSIKFYGDLTVSSTSNISITVNPSGTVTEEELDETVETAIVNAHKTYIATIPHTGWINTKNILFATGVSKVAISYTLGNYACVISGIYNNNKVFGYGSIDSIDLYNVETQQKVATISFSITTEDTQNYLTLNGTTTGNNFMVFLYGSDEGSTLITDTSTYINIITVTGLSKLKKATISMFYEYFDFYDNASSANKYYTEDYNTICKGRIFIGDNTLFVTAPAQTTGATGYDDLKLCIKVI